ncbi:MAG: PHP domain-containing protein, partial [Parasporobacterium sp.]|nr:PHP domain-containing protein [Parasporobacterium sp.]
MQDFMYHIHTFRCNHAVGDDEDYVKAAIKAGYKVMGFSDHAPIEQTNVNRYRMGLD